MSRTHEELTNTIFAPSPSSSLSLGNSSELEEKSGRRGSKERTMSSSVPSSSRTTYIDRSGNMAPPSRHSQASADYRREGVPRDSYLPTPQTRSPSNVLPYFPGVNAPPESPLAYTHARTLGGTIANALVSRTSQRPFSPPRDQVRPLQPQQVVTPETSPSGPWKRAISPPHIRRRPSSAPLLSTKAHPPSPKQDTSQTTLAPAHIISPPVSVYSKSQSPEARSNLSSPFIEKLRLHDDQTVADESVPLAKPPAELLTPQPKPSFAAAEELFSPLRLSERQSSPTQSDVPTPPPLVELPPLENERTAGGELARIREHLSSLASLDQARVEALEDRRPEYLKRFGPDAHDFQDGPVLEETRDSLGIATSPNKGRRLQLFDFQETSAESFEESLMTYGYGTYGEPRTPQRNIFPQAERSQEMQKWLAYSTPTGPSSISSVKYETELTENELKKRKRLEAFKLTAARAHAKLYPTESAYYGRVLASEDVDYLVGTPSKKRASGKKKKNVNASPDRKGKAATRPLQGREDFQEPRWLDNEFPWSIREKEREDELNARNLERLKCIERYFSRDTDSEEETEVREVDDEEVLPSSTWGHEYEDPPLASRRGRGKAVPLRPNPRTPSKNVQPSSSTQKSKYLYLPSDPADARAALLSKRSVRNFVQRKLGRNISTRDDRDVADDGQFGCACGERDSKPAVECSSCKLWFHFACIGVRDEAELGDEDALWFCSDACLQTYDQAQEQNLVQVSPERPARQPIFVPTDDRPARRSMDDVALLSSSSPFRLETPQQGHNRRLEEFHRSSLWDPLPSFEGGNSPSTPLSASGNPKVRTPGGRFDELGNDELSMTIGFDPLSTPSRPGLTGSLKFSNMFSTPKQPMSNIGAGGSALGPSWASRAGQIFATPIQRSRLGSAGFGFGGEDSAGAQLSAQYGFHARGTALYGADDTPIRRAPVRDNDGSPPPSSLANLSSPTGPNIFSGHAFDSPSAGRGSLVDNSVMRSGSGRGHGSRRE